MVKVAGKYKVFKNENIVEYSKALGIPEDVAQKIDAARNTLEVIIEGDKVTLATDTTSGINTSTLILGKEVDEKLVGTIPIKSTAKLDGDTLTVSSKTADGKAGTRVYKFSDSGLVVTLTGDGAPLAKRHYNRL